jgi:PEP-CTERM motif
VFSADFQNIGSGEVNLTGMLALANTSVLQVNTLGGFTTTAGQMFTLINNDGTDAINGTFSNATSNGSIITAGGFSFYVNYDGGTGNDLVLTTVPEPSTWVTAALALGAIGWMQSRRFGQMLKRCEAETLK